MIIAILILVIAVNLLYLQSSKSVLLRVHRSKKLDVLLYKISIPPMEFRTWKFGGVGKVIHVWNFIT